MFFNLDLSLIADSQPVILATAPVQRVQQPKTFSIGLAVESDSGISNQDGITKETAPLLRGRAEPGSRINISVDGSLIGETQTRSTGIWEFRLHGLSDGDHELRATRKTQSGESQQATQKITIDTRNPLINIQDLPDGVALEPDQTFSGSVADTDPNIKLDYWITGESSATPIPLRLSRTSSNIPTYSFGKVQLRKIAKSPFMVEQKIYIRAIDRAGNETVYDYSFMRLLLPKMDDDYFLKPEPKPDQFHPNIKSKTAKSERFNLRWNYTQINSENGNCQLQTIAPQLTGLSNRSVEKTVNEQLASLANQARNTYQTTLQTSDYCMKDSTSRMKRSIMMDRCWVQLQVGNIVSFACSEIHQNQQSSQFSRSVTVSLKTGKIYRYPDLFRPDRNAIKAVGDLIRNTNFPNESVASRLKLSSLSNPNADFYLSSRCREWGSPKPEPVNNRGCLIIPNQQDERNWRGDASIPFHHLKDLLSNDSDLQLLVQE